MMIYQRPSRDSAVFRDQENGYLIIHQKLFPQAEKEQMGIPVNR